MHKASSEGRSMREAWGKGQKMRCSSEGCTNQAVRGGVCIKHGAKHKRCSSEGCTNQVVKKGVCWRHGAKVPYRNHDEESTAFASCFGSEFDKTTFTHPNQRTPSASTIRGSVPEQVVIRGNVAENLVEV